MSRETPFSDSFEEPDKSNKDNLRAMIDENILHTHPKKTVIDHFILGILKDSVALSKIGRNLSPAEKDVFEREKKKYESLFVDPKFSRILTDFKTNMHNLLDYDFLNEQERNYFLKDITESIPQNLEIHDAQLLLEKTTHFHTLHRSLIPFIPADTSPDHIEKAKNKELYDNLHQELLKHAQARFEEKHNILMRGTIEFKGLLTTFDTLHTILEKKLIELPKNMGQEIYSLQGVCETILSTLERDKGDLIASYGYAQGEVTKASGNFDFHSTFQRKDFSNNVYRKALFEHVQYIHKHFLFLGKDSYPWQEKQQSIINFLERIFNEQKTTFIYISAIALGEMLLSAEENLLEHYRKFQLLENGVEQSKKVVLSQLEKLPASISLITTFGRIESIQNKVLNSLGRIQTELLGHSQHKAELSLMINTAEEHPFFIFMQILNLNESYLEQNNLFQAEYNECFSKLASLALF